MRAVFPLWYVYKRLRSRTMLVFKGKESGIFLEHKGKENYFPGIFELIIFQRKFLYRKTASGRRIECSFFVKNCFSSLLRIPRNTAVFPVHAEHLSILMCAYLLRVWCRVICKEKSRTQKIWQIQRLVGIGFMRSRQPVVLC